jgi:hypothetical protein
LPDSAIPSEIERTVDGGLMPHDFRRSTARSLVRTGVPERVAMAVTRQKTRANLRSLHA